MGSGPRGFQWRPHRPRSRHVQLLHITVRRCIVRTSRYEHAITLALISFCKGVAQNFTSIKWSGLGVAYFSCLRTHASQPLCSSRGCKHNVPVLLHVSNALWFWCMWPLSLGHGPNASRNHLFHWCLVNTMKRSECGTINGYSAEHFCSACAKRACRKANLIARAQQKAAATSLEVLCPQHSR